MCGFFTARSQFFSGPPLFSVKNVTSQPQPHPLSSANPVHKPAVLLTLLLAVPQGTELTFRNSELTCKDSKLPFRNSELTFKDSGLTFRNPELTFRNCGVTRRTVATRQICSSVADLKARAIADSKPLQEGVGTGNNQTIYFRKRGGTRALFLC